ncbi:hypothetical protein, partial [Collinsella aerofaciens]
MKGVCRKLVAALLFALLIWPITTSHSFATEQDSLSRFNDLVATPVDQLVDFSLDGLAAEATDGGSPLLGDECEL